MILTAFGFLNMSFADVLDILLVAIVIFFAFRWMRNSSAINIFIAILILFIIRLIVVALNMKMMSSLMGTVIDVGVLALIIIFQPEIRHFLIKLGSGQTFFSRFFSAKADHMAGATVNEIVEACNVMSEQKTGALIVIPHKTSLQYIVETGDKIDAQVSSRLLMNLFFKNSPLHDGAVIIGNGRVVAARCTLPITSRIDIPAHYGMRHKAAIGITEESDAEVIVVSEETGTISHVYGGKVQTISSNNNLKNILLNDRHETGDQAGV